MVGKGVIAGPPVRSLEHRERLLDRISVGLFGGLVLIVLATFADYGTSWDEYNHVWYGDDILKYFRAGMTEAAVPGHHRNYGGGFNVVAAWFSELFPHDRHTSTHLLTALVGLLGLMGAWRLGRLLAGPAGGLAALILLAALPAYYGHMFNNPKDLPFAAAHVWALYYLCRLIQAGPRAPNSLWVRLAVAIGLSMTVRIGGLLGLVYLAGILGLQWLGFCRREPRLRPRLRLLADLTLRGLFVTEVAWALMILPWPAAHRALFKVPFESLSRFSEWSFNALTLFRGEFVPSHPPPWDYLPGYFLVQLPDVLWLILACGALMLAVYLARSGLRGARWSWRSACLAFLVFAVLFPPTYAILRRSTIYDGLRHFIFVLPPLCALAAMAVSKLLSWLAARSRPAAYATLSILGLGVAAVLVEMVELHPYQYVYYNRMTGGLPAAAMQYETEYYAHSFKELGEKLAERLWSTDRERYLNGDYQVMGCGIRHYLLLDHMPANFGFVREPAPPSPDAPSDFYAGYRRGHCIWSRSHLPPLVAVARQGVLLNVLRDRRGELKENGDGEHNP